jgi:hypothetical protein
MIATTFQLWKYINIDYYKPIYKLKYKYHAHVIFFPN